MLNDVATDEQTQPRSGFFRCDIGLKDAGPQVFGNALAIIVHRANAIYRGKPGGDFTPVIENVKSPADIGYDTKRGRVLVPLFESNEVRAYDLK